MLIPCAKGEKQCFPCEGDGSLPYANLSSEAPDTNIWTSVQFRRKVNVTPNIWKRDTCVGFCESSVSQTDADDCAARRAEECLPEPPLPPIPPQPPGNPPAVFCNQEITAQSGSSCYTIPVCTVFAPSQAGANAIAQSMADSRVLNPELSSPCAPIFPPAPEPPPALPCDECCNCGAIVQIEGYTPSFFTLDPASLDVNDTTDGCNIPPTSDARNLSGKNFSIPDNGWLFCTADERTNFYFFKQFGSWFKMADAGFCVPIVDAQVLIKPVEAYPAGEPFDGAIILKHYPYDLGFGTGDWDGRFILTDNSFTTCAVQHFSTKHINGVGGFTIQLDKSGDGPSAIWTLNIKRYYFADDFGSSCVPSLANFWVGEHVGETQCGTYNKTGGSLFTAPSSLNIIAVP